ncbi:MAG: hypothetical protein AAF449_09430 [Myxococcota bacterium]
MVESIGAAKVNDRLFNSLSSRWCKMAMGRAEALAAFTNGCGRQSVAATEFVVGNAQLTASGVYNIVTT